MEQAVTRAVRAGDQILPKPGQVDVGPRVIDDVELHRSFVSESLVAGVKADFEARITLGIERYGHPLQTHNGRDATRDAYDELLDAAHYLKQLLLEAERPKARLAYWSVLGLVFDVKALMTDD